MRITTLPLLSVIAFAPCLSAQAPSAASGAKSALDKSTLEAYLRHVELWLPQVQVKIDDPKPSPYSSTFNEVVVHLSYNGGSLDQTYLVSKDGRNIVKGDIYDITKSPFQANLDKLRIEGQPAYGPATAPVTLVVFGDFQCPVCKQEATVLRKNVVETFPKEVRVVFKDFPLESIHPWARAASVAARCVYQQDASAFWKYHDWIYEDQQNVSGENLNAKVLEWAGKNGVDSVKLGRCLESKASEGDVNKNVADGRALGVDATPTLFLNGRKLVGAVQWETLQALVKLEAEDQAKKSEECCVVNVPKVVK